jgi:hypothetical protein
MSHPWYFSREPQRALQQKVDKDTSGRALHAASLQARRVSDLPPVSLQNIIFSPESIEKLKKDEPTLSTNMPSPPYYDDMLELLENRPLFYRFQKLAVLNGSSLDPFDLYRNIKSLASKYILDIRSRTNPPLFAKCLEYAPT